MEGGSGSAGIKLPADTRIVNDGMDCHIHPLNTGIEMMELKNPQS
ncbi:hypothetical protein RMSM_02126 [Rhodopirellula maiorica SM1]|uniref:Uncharacterized protein n=1 Tax=Rhodopirellula maiorica SM1 TaxID=1265738 RepID=M5RZW8_9BACT|nr:hypothetical protein RMSM_02126 [Rhodopirellula maiorica SM1]